MPFADPRPGQLSPREIEVMAALAQGCTTKQIAARLHIAPRTAFAHIRSIKLKLGAKTREEAIYLAAVGGIIRP